MNSYYKSFLIFHYVYWTTTISRWSINRVLDFIVFKFFKFSWMTVHFTFGIYFFNLIIFLFLNFVRIPTDNCFFFFFYNHLTKINSKPSISISNVLFQLYNSIIINLLFFKLILFFIIYFFCFIKLGLKRFSIHSRIKPYFRE